MLGVIKGTALHFGRLCARKAVDGRLFFLGVRPGALRVSSDTPLWIDHNRFSRVVGAELTFDNDGERLTFRAGIPDSTDGRTVLAGVRDGSCAGVSVGLEFDIHADCEWQEIDGDLLCWVTRGAIQELSVVDKPAIRGCTAYVADGDGDDAESDLDRRIAAERDRRERYHIARMQMGGGW